MPKSQTGSELLRIIAKDSQKLTPEQKEIEKQEIQESIQSINKQRKIVKCKSNYVQRKSFESSKNSYITSYS